MASKCCCTKLKKIFLHKYIYQTFLDRNFFVTNYKHLKFLKNET